MRKTPTAGIPIAPSHATERTQDGLAVRAPRDAAAVPAYEATVILISHPENRRLGSRYRIVPGAELAVGRSSEAAISLPEVPSLSRRHAVIRFARGVVTLEDLGSRNGSYVNDRRLRGAAPLHSGDRFQLGAVHFKFLHERDVEHAYHEAIYEMVARDGLTGAYNRRKLAEEAAREIARARRHSRPLALLMLDLDHFKRVNDEHGHLAGDAVLQQVVARVQTMVRAEAVFARLGGEEFALLCPETDLAGALVLGETLRRAVEERAFDGAGVEVSVTCSCGIAEFSPEMERLEELLSAADQALYRAKQEGRNRVRAGERPTEAGGGVRPG